MHIFLCKAAAFIVCCCCFNVVFMYTTHKNRRRSMKHKVEEKPKHQKGIKIQQQKLRVFCSSVSVWGVFCNGICDFFTYVQFSRIKQLKVQYFTINISPSISSQFKEQNETKTSMLKCLEQGLPSKKMGTAIVQKSC